MKNNIIKVIDVAMEVTEKTPHDVFFDYSGHVDWFVLTVHVNGWKRDGIKEDIHRFRYDKYHYRNGYKSMIRFLESLLE